MLEKKTAEIAAALERNKIPYLVVGGQAVLLHGEPRLTQDIDITLGVGPDRVEDLLTVMKGLFLRSDVRDPDEFARKNFVLPARDVAGSVRVDFIFSNTEFEKEAIKRGKKIDFEGTMVNFASVEDLVVMKIFASRPRDIEDARIVLLKNPKCDLAYVRKWLKRFDAMMKTDAYSSALRDTLKLAKNGK